MRNIPFILQLAIFDSNTVLANDITSVETAESKSRNIHQKMYSLYCNMNPKGQFQTISAN
jgi:hypothetical protein